MAMSHIDKLLKRLETANRRLADQQHALDVSSIVAITDKSGTLTYVNESFCKISGYSSEELLGKTHRMINSGTHPSSFFKSMWNTIAAGQEWKGEICNRAKDGALYWVDTTIVPFFKEGEAPYQYIAIRQDITSRKVAEDSLILEREKLFLSEKMASLGMLSTGISHELGNPLGALRGRIEMLEMQASQGEDLPAAAVSESLGKMIGLVDRMANIIRGLRSYSRDGSDDPKGPVHVGQLLTDILEISKDRCQKHGIQIQISDFSSELQALAREAELAQVIVNLFNNAVDAAKKEEKPQIGISLSEVGENISLEICNNGPSIPKEIMSKIFDPFFTTKPVGEGTGLGLSICRSIVNAHDGELSVSSKNMRTCFTMRIPKIKSNQKTIESPTEP